MVGKAWWDALRGRARSEPDEMLRYGYWPTRRRRGEIPPAIRNPDDYDGGAVLNVACTQTGLPRSGQRRLVQAWVERLPGVPAKTIVFSSRVTQELFAAACAAPALEALSVKWSSVASLEPLRGALSLRALFLGSSPGAADLGALRDLPRLRWLFLENVAEPVDLAFLEGLPALRELGISASRGRRLAVRSLHPVADLAHLEMLWLVSIVIEEGGLAPLHALEQLVSLRSTIREDAPEIRALRAALPGLRYLEPVG